MSVEIKVKIWLRTYQIGKDFLTSDSNLHLSIANFCRMPMCREVRMAKGELWTIFLPSGCADAHAFPLLEESNTTEAKVVKALPNLAVKTKGDSSMERKRSAGGTRSQEAVQARPYRVSPGLGKRQATRCR